MPSRSIRGDSFGFCGQRCFVPSCFSYNQYFRVAIKDDFVQRATVLRNVQFGEVSGRLAGLLDWMEQQQPIREIIENLRRTTDGEALILQGTFHEPPPANTPDEIAAVGLVLMEACRNEDFANVCLSRGIG